MEVPEESENAVVAAPVWKFPSTESEGVAVAASGEIIEANGLDTDDGGAVAASGETVEANGLDTDPELSTAPLPLPSRHTHLSKPTPTRRWQ